MVVSSDGAGKSGSFEVHLSGKWEWRFDEGRSIWRNWKVEAMNSRIGRQDKMRFGCCNTHFFRSQISILPFTTHKSHQLQNSNITQ